MMLTVFCFVLYIFILYPSFWAMHKIDHEHTTGTCLIENAFELFSNTTNYQAARITKRDFRPECVYRQFLLLGVAMETFRAKCQKRCGGYILPAITR